jgi:hypothetical protein
MSISNLYPAISPSLSLDFANTKALDPRITFTRTTTATYYNGVTTAKAEENLLIRSEEFDNAAWSKLAATVTANSIAAPNGTTTADLITEASGTTQHGIFLASPALAGNGLPVTFSIYLYAGTQQYLHIILGSGGVSYFGIIVDTVNWTIPTTGAIGTATYISSSITSVGGDWYRVVITGTNPSGTNSSPQIYGSDNTTLQYVNKTSAGSLTWYLWGAQLEQRSAVTAYTPTTTQPITNYIPVLLTAASGVARFDHNPVTGESLGLLIEGQRSNLVTYSDDFADAAWTKTRASITSNTIVAPNGTLTGDKLFVDTQNGWHYILQSISVTSGTTYTLSVYAKKAEQEYIQIHFPSTQFGDSNAANGAVFNLSTGAISAQGSTLLAASITSVGNGWYRCSITKAATSTATATIPITLVNQATFSTTGYTGDGYSGIYIWGAQLEAGAFPTSYIQTVAATVTRNADAASMTGANFTSWFNNAEGTVYSEASTYAQTASDKRVWAISTGATANNMSQHFGSTSGGILNSVINTNNVFQYGPNEGAYSGGVYYKRALAFINNNPIAVTNSVIASSSGASTTILPANLSQLDIANRLNSQFLNGTIKKLAFYPIRATNAQLQALTS